MTRRPRAFVVRLAAIVAGGVALRALYLFTIARDVTGIGDWHFYHWQANLIANGRGFLDPYALLNGDTVPSAGHPPLYPLVLAGVSKLGGTGELSHRALGLILGAITIVLIALLARRAAGDRAGLIAAAIAAVYPALIAADGALMSESLYGLLVAGALLACWQLMERPGPWPAAAAGALIALAALTRSEALLLIPALVIPLAWRAGPAAHWVRIAAAVGAFAVVLAPWTIRNATTFERFVPISTNDATVIAGANCPKTYAGVDMGGWNLACISMRSTKEESVQADRWRREGMHYARTHVSRWPAVATVRFLRVWDLYQPRRQVMFAEGRERTVVKVGIVVFWLLAPLAAWGLVLLRRRGVPVIVLTVPFAVVSFTAVTGYGVPRLRHMAEIPLVVLAAVAVDQLVRRRQERSAASTTPASTSAGSVTAGISHIQSTAA
jgi:4-amino-4-deoxy-L-arabinose transferase-like glycosyltransferase